MDIIGGLPSKDKGQEEKHLDILFSKAKRQGKMVHVHIDQKNDPEEHETELFIKKVEEFELQGKAVIIHMISLICHPKDYRKKFTKS